ncbi:GNAT family N-acetyltransferase [Tissierella sp. MSJ-40]|uniref:GNAT family N-acetyltransferase n=1 Tax=Tissierella simiarum TaxID=2841534 RepID=A0ABS6E8B3_9FIRM|nr:GNAT family N-acetyltransferase [Tissierella simiarum]MBU5439155.1 GNAT family N-acetyltransferase [Tissierella simiarum]
MIKIRYAEIKDVEGMVDVNFKTWRTTYTGIINEDFLLEREKKREDRIERSKNNFGKLGVEGRKVYKCVAIDNENIVGIVTYGKCREEDKFDLINSGEIYAIYILKEYQQRGIGKKLIDFAVKDLMNENYNKVVIWALKDNPSVEFYRKIGGDSRLMRNIKIGNQLLEEIGFVYDDMAELLNSTRT